MFGSGTGAVQQQSNVRRRILAPPVARANERFDREGLERLPERLTPHSLRRTLASILVAIGEDPEYVMGACGHTDPALTLRIYAHQMRRRDGEREPDPAKQDRDTSPLRPRVKYRVAPPT